MIRLDLRRYVLTLDERRAEENEGIGRAGNVVLRLLFAMSRTTPSGTFSGGREENGFEWGVDESGGLIEGDGSDIGSERNVLE